MTVNNNILVCGLGSMGKRRIGILCSLFPDVEIFGTDQSVDRCAEAEKQFNMRIIEDYYKDFSSVNPEVVFVCTPPLAHSDFVIYALENKAHTFSEINLTAKGYEKIISVADKNKKIAFLSSTFLYREEINWIIEEVKSQNNLSYRYHVGQYLPDWHPWEKYTDFFVSQKESSACREIMAIEFPWLIKAFGKVKNFKTMKTRSSSLDLDYEDNFHILFEHENGVQGAISIDCVSIRGLRRLEVYSDKMYFEWEGVPDSLKMYSPEDKQMAPVPLYKDIEKNKKYSQFIIENPYIEEIKNFFLLKDGKVDSKKIYGYEDDLSVIRLIEELHMEKQ